MTDKLPFLPGYNTTIKPKTHFPKAHVFDVQNGVRVDVNKTSDFVDQRAYEPEVSMSLSQQSMDFQNALDAKYRTSSMLNNTSSLPAWVAYDRKVLRFYAYFKEAVFSSPVEPWRFRKCVLYYYLEDDSVHIAEPKVENSGIAQGTFVKRHRIPKENYEFINLNDLQIPSELSIYGRTFHIYDCDDFTRAFFAESGLALGPPLAPPMDAFTKKHIKEPTTFKKLMHPMKEWQEASLGKQMGLDIRATQKFLKNDRCVLRFFCVWKDEKMYGETRPYVLHYFLADDTVEIMEVKQANSGRDGYPALLKRSKLPKEYTEVAPDLTRIGSNTNAKVQYYTEKDLLVGGVVYAYGRELNVCGCDDFTKRFYIDNYGMNEEEFPVIEDHAQGNRQAVLKVVPPEYNGFGSEEDSLGSFLYLMPKVPKIDFKKQMENWGLNLRWLAKFKTPKAEDKNRRFIITYFMNNDTMSIYEKFLRNSGFIGGSFLERTKIKNPETGEYYTTKDLFVGRNIRLNFFDFEIIEADAFTVNFMRKNPGLFTFPDGKIPEENPEVNF